MCTEFQRKEGWSLFLNTVLQSKELLGKDGKGAVLDCCLSQDPALAWEVGGACGNTRKRILGFTLCSVFFSFIFHDF